MRLHTAMERLYPVCSGPAVSYTAEHYGQRSPQGISAQQQLNALFTADVSGEQHLDLAKVKEHLQRFGDLLRSDGGQAIIATQQVLDIAQALLLALEQLREANACDLAILQRLLHDAQERIGGYEAIFQRHSGGEVF